MVINQQKVGPHFIQEINNMPSKSTCAKIKDPKERSDCENYRGKYAKKVKSSYKDVLSGASTRDSLRTMKKELK